MAFPDYPLGASIPNVPHAILFSMPTVRDHVGFVTREARVHDTLLAGYPRFFVHKSIQKLVDICLPKVGASSDERCILVPSKRIADRCQQYLVERSPLTGLPVPSVRTSPLSFHEGATTVYVVLFPSSVGSVSLELWQNAGVGITSRFAEHCLLSTAELAQPTPTRAQVGNPEQPPLDDATIKLTLRSRIAELHTPANSTHPIQPDDVFLFPSGMSAIWHTHQLFLALQPEAKSVCFGFLYLDTQKVLERWGQGSHFFGRMDDNDFDALEAILEGGERPSFLCTEAPSNPLLRTPNIQRLRALADRFAFPIVVDTSVGSINVDVLPWADIVINSLSKVFSGNANVMGGSVILNPRSLYHDILKSRLSASFEDVWFAQDAAVMEENSRDLVHRMKIIDENTLAVCEFLRSQSLFSDASLIKDVFYPKYSTPENYQRLRTPTGGFGGLMSITLKSDAAAHVFFNTLECAKCASFGTTFTLGCAYTILAHYGELEYAAGYGVTSGLIRVSVGMEDLEDLLDMLKKALRAAEEATLVDV